MHKVFRDKFKELDLKISEVEDKIGCTANYLSRFINGPKDLPPKWEKKIQAFIDGIEKELKAIQPKNPDFDRPWIKLVEAYCLSIGKDPEGLIEDHKVLAAFKRTHKHPSAQVGEVKVQDLTAEVPKSNYTVNTLSTWAEENRKKKLGLKD